MQSNIIVVNSGSAAIANIASADGLASSPVRATALSYATSLLAAFGRSLAKQWIAQFKATRSTRGSPSSRGIHRQRKFDVLQDWYFNAVMDCSPALLQGVSVAVRDFIAG